MKVTLEKRGGQAAAINLRLPPRSLDAATLPPADAAQLARLIADAKAAPARAQQKGIPGDAMSYRITIEEGATPIELHQSDTSMSPAFSALLDWLERRFTKK